MKRPPSTYRPRKGDVVAVLAVVKFDHTRGEDDVHLALVGHEHRSARVKLDEIMEVVDYGWAVGDRVRAAAVQRASDVGTIKAIDEKNIWVRHDTGSYLTYAPADLEPIHEERVGMFDEVEEPAPPPRLKAVSETGTEEASDGRI